MGKLEVTELTAKEFLCRRLCRGDHIDACGEAMPSSEYIEELLEVRDLSRPNVCVDR